MAKNRVTPERATKKKDNFFNKSQSNFKSKIKVQNKRNIPKSQNKTQYSVEEHSFKPSQSGSDNFFVKPANATELNKVTNPKIKPENDNTRSCKSEKKPFNKKKYRLQKYSKKYKLQQWEDQRKKAVLRGYYRTIKEDEQKLDVKRIYEEHEDDETGDANDKINEENENNLNVNINQERVSNSNTFNNQVIDAKNSKGKKSKAFWKAESEFQRIRKEKQKKKEEMLQKKAEQQEALEVYKKKKTEKYKKLSRKTKRGQPIMKDRIEMLLEKIQNSVE